MFHVPIKNLLITFYKNVKRVLCNLLLIPIPWHRGLKNDLTLWEHLHTSFSQGYLTIFISTRKEHVFYRFLRASHHIHKKVLLRFKFKDSILQKTWKSNVVFPFPFQFAFNSFSRKPKKGSFHGIKYSLKEISRVTKYLFQEFLNNKLI